MAKQLCYNLYHKVKFPREMIGQIAVQGIEVMPKPAMMRAFTNSPVYD